MLRKQLTILMLLPLLFGCASSKDVRVQDQPPKFFGRVLQNTLSRYNSVYNSNYIYSSSLIAGEDGYSENYNAPLLSVSVQDAVAGSGSMTSEMDQILNKTATDIDKRPYSKWVDDNYLLNGIAHYIKQDYEKAIDIFLYTSSEYKNGIDFERVGSRQKVKAVNQYKERKKQAEERLQEIERERKDAENAAKNAEKDRKANAKKYAARNDKKRKVATREEQAAARKKAKEEGRDVNTAEILKEIRDNERKATAAKKRITQKDIEQINNAPILVNDNADNPGFLAHPLAAKDAMLWLAKTYITSDKFIAANAVLTAINEDVTFPNRLNVDYYLTYADLYVKLDNNDKAIEYVKLAIEDSKNRNKGRLYYLLGQLYEQKGDDATARAAFEMVEKYHPEYNMIYYAKMRNYKRALENGEFNSYDYTNELRKMANDVKNEEFYSEVYYYLGEAYLAQEENEKGVLAMEASIEEQVIQPFSHYKPQLALANYYYKNNNYAKAQQNYSDAVENMKEDNAEKEFVTLKAQSLEKVVAGQQLIAKKDSLLNLAKLSTDELNTFLEKKAKAEIRNRLKQSLESANSSFGNDSSKFQNNQNKRKGRGANSNGVFYFYDLNIASTGFSEFKRVWGDRENIDNWRRKTSTKNQKVSSSSKSDKKVNESNLSKDQLISSYLAEIPISKEEEEATKAEIQSEYLTIANIFVKELGEYEKGEEVLKDFVDNRYPSQDQMKEVQELLILTYKMKGDDDYIKSLQQTKEGRKALEKTAQNRKIEVAGIEKLYELTYTAFAKEDYKKALSYIEQTKRFSNKEYDDKFAYIKAISIGQLEGRDVLIKQIKNFIDSYPKSSLLTQAEDIYYNRK